MQPKGGFPTASPVEGSRSKRRRSRRREEILVTYEDKIERAQELVAQHNDAVGDNAVDFEAFFAKLKKSGGTSEDRLRACSFEDLENWGLPKLLANEVGRVFRDTKEAGKKAYISSARAAAMSVAELLSQYDPREADNPVGKRLVEISKNQPCVVFNDDGSVNVEASTNILNEIREGYPSRDTVIVEGIPQPVYRVDERPDQFADENPLYPGRPLRPNGDCDQTSRSWNGVPHKLRVLLHLARTRTGELKVDSVREASTIMDLAVAGDESQIRRFHPEASKLYDELERKGDIPSLKIALGGTSGARRNDPFAVGSGHRTS